MRPPLQPRRVLLGIIGLVTISLAIDAVYIWRQGDETGALALATAVATFSLAFGAVLTIDQNAALVQAAIDEARASSDEAKASRETVDEMRRQRALAYKPWLVITRAVTGPNLGSTRPLHVFRVINIGAGPAVNVALNAVAVPQSETQPRSWVSAEVQGIAPGGDWETLVSYGRAIEGSPGPRADRYRCVTDDLALQVLGDDVVAVRYEDIFGTHYRSSPDVHHSRVPEEWNGAATVVDAPDWLRCQG